MNLDNLYPYLACGGYQKNSNVWVFFTPYGETEIKNANGIISYLVPLCNGELNLAEIIEKTKGRFNNKKDAKDFITKLFKLGILSDKFQVYETWKIYGENPMIFFRDILEKDASELIRTELPKDETTQEIQASLPGFALRDILGKRCSTREFSAKPLKTEDIIGLFWSSYGAQEKRNKIWKYGEEKTFTVPSGGGLYPLVLYLVQFKDIQNLARGVYRWNSEKLIFERLNKQGRLENLKEIMTGIDSLKDAAGIVVVTAEYERVSKKYANKAYPLVLLEAGHIMQNAYLYCAEKGIGFVELLGFDHEKLVKSLMFNKKLAPVVMGVFGTKEEEHDNIEQKS